MVEHVELHLVGEESDIVDDDPVDIRGGGRFAVGHAVRNTNLLPGRAKVSLGFIEFGGARRRRGQPNHEVEWIRAEVRQSIRGRVRSSIKRQVSIDSSAVLAAWPTDTGEEALPGRHLYGLWEIKGDKLVRCPTVYGCIVKGALFKVEGTSP